MPNKEHPTDVDSVKTEMLAQESAPLDDDAIDWRKTADRRLTKLTEAEHDLSVVRDRFDYLQSSHRLLLQQSEERLARIHELERELEELRSPRSRFRGVFGRWLVALRPRVKACLVFIIALVLRVPLVRPVVRRVLRAFPELAGKLRARLLGSRRPE